MTAPETDCGSAADRATGPTGPARPVTGRSALVVLWAALVFLAAGCGNLIPGSSPVIAYTSQASANGGEGVRVWPPEPGVGEAPAEIIDGFLLSSASGSADVEIAKDYLTGAAKSGWAGGQIFVYHGNPVPVPVAGSPGEYQLPLDVVATVNSTGRYSTAPTSPDRVQFDFHLSKTQYGYRIDRLPAGFGMAMDEEQFRSGYNPFSVFYADADSPSRPGMIPVQFYVSADLSNQAVATQLAADLVAGPPAWVSGVATVAAQAQSATAPQVQIGQSGVARVTLSGSAACAGGACQELADELRISFDAIGSITGVDLVDKQGQHLASAQSPTLIKRAYGIEMSGATARSGVSGGGLFYFVDSAGRIERSGGGPGTVVKVGPRGVRYAAVAAGSGAAGTIELAAVNAARTALYVSVVGAAPAANPVFTGTGIGSLTWDAYGDLWFTAVYAGVQNLYRLAAQQTAPQIVAYDNALGGNVQQIAVSPDGNRVAVIYSRATGAGAGASSGSGTVYGLALGVAAGNSGSGSVGGFWSLDLADAARQLLTGWSGIADVVWTDSRSLAVLGTQTPSSSPTIYEIYSDGSPVIDSTSPGLDEVTVIPPGGTSAIGWAAADSLLLAQCSSCAGGSSGGAPAPGGGTPGVNSGQSYIEGYDPTTGSWSALVAGTWAVPVG